jgi:hypothetical protein
MYNLIINFKTQNIQKIQKHKNSKIIEKIQNN